jgi:hypothetical protein
MRTRKAGIFRDFGFGHSESSAQAQDNAILTVMLGDELWGAKTSVLTA